MSLDSASSLKLLSFNIQAGTPTVRYSDYFTRSWKQLFPHGERMETLDEMASLVAEHDMVALQEADAGSLRSGFINQTRYLAEQAPFPYWSHQPNRKVAKIAYPGNGLLARNKPFEVIDLKLPGTIPGRGALVARFGRTDNALTVANLHLALGRRARESQLRFLVESLSDASSLVVLGDFNATLDTAEVRHFMQELQLHAPEQELLTYPSWRPQRGLDHCMVSSDLRIESFSCINCMLSDHRPVSVRIALPRALESPTSNP